MPKKTQPLLTTEMDQSTSAVIIKVLDRRVRLKHIPGSKASLLGLFVYVIFCSLYCANIRSLLDDVNQACRKEMFVYNKTKLTIRYYYQYNKATTTQSYPW